MKKSGFVGALCAGLVLMPVVYTQAAEDFDIDVVGFTAVEFDDNITSKKEDEISDWLTRLMVGVEVLKLGPTYELNVGGHFNQELFFSESGFDASSQDVAAKLVKEFSPYDRLTVSNTFVSAENNRELEEEFGRVSGRYEFIRNRFNAEYERDLSKRLAWHLAYGNEIYEVDRDDLRDSLQNLIRTSLDYLLTPRTTVGLFYEFVTREFDPGSDAHINTLGSQFRHFFNSRLYLEGHAGAAFIKTFNGDDLTKPDIRLALVQEVEERTVASLIYSQQHRLNSSTEDIFDAWRVTASIAREVFRRLKAGIGVFYGEGEFVATDTQDDLQGLEARLDYEITEDISTFLTYTFIDSDSNAGDRTYQRNIVSVGCAFRF